MRAKYTPKTFRQDHVIRDEMGKPLGRIVMRNDGAYQEGKDIEVAILKIPVELKEHIVGSIIYVDEYGYKIPENLPEFRNNRRDRDWIASSFVLLRA